ncbi:MAG: 2-amino-4-hydroxy-6-hydroxymethyldihydropteridine diphosphokinase [Flammeovirgaceae bacterium]
MESNVFILLGSNLGDKAALLTEATTTLEAQVGTVLQASAVYQTAAWGNQQQPDFLNQVLRLSTSLTPHVLLEKILLIEEQMGRKRTGRWAARTIDIDLLYYGQEVIDSPNLTLPHPAIADRKFTLIPLAEIAPDFVHPIFKKTNKALLIACVDTLEVTTGHT